MKKIILIILTLISTLIPIHATEFYAKNYIILNADTLQVLEGKKIHETQSVASISKIMTAILVIENTDLNTQITLNDSIKKAYGSGIYVHIGDTITIQDLLYGLMLRSGNDAAIALADYTGNGVKNFVQMMNDKAQILGMSNTHFSNPSGLDEEDSGNVSSVYDMAILMSYCINNPIFVTISGTMHYKRLDLQGKWLNKNKLLSLYEYTIAGKTGYTVKAKRTLINAAKKDDITLICVTFNCGDDFNFQKYLFETYFEQFNQIKILFQGVNYIGHYKIEMNEDLNFSTIDSNYQKVFYKIVGNQVELFYSDYSLGTFNYQYIKYPFINRILETFVRLFYE